MLAFTFHAKAINNILNENNIPVLWMKGLALAYSVYDTPWKRQMRDIDFIVPLD